MIIMVFPKNNHIESKEKQVTLSLWLFGNTGLEDLVTKYEELHPNVRVFIQHSPYHELSDKLQTALATGSGGPDVALVEVSFIERFKQLHDYFYNLNNYAEPGLKDKYLDWKWKQASSADGSFVIGLPTDIGPIAMAYRTDLFKKAGLPTNPDQVAAQLSTWDKFLQAGKQVRERTGKAMIDNLDSLYRTVLGQSTDQYYDAATGKLILEESSGVSRAWRIAMQAKQDNLTAHLANYTLDWSNGIQNKDFAVIMTPAWMLDYIKSTDPQSSGMWNITFVPEVIGSNGGSFLSLPKDGQHPKEAFQLIEWLTAPAQQLEIFKNKGNFPSTPEIYKNPIIEKKTDLYFSSAPIGRIYAEVARRNKPVYEGPDHFIISKAEVYILQSVENNELQPEKAWEKFIKNVQEQLHTE
jgi:cellobiose transport system substrate-binding protein